MARAGRRFPLLIYRAMIDRWWPATLFLAFALFLLAWPVYKDPLAQVQPWRWMGLIALGGLALAFTVMLLVMRSMAYVQAFPNYLKLVTPFLRFSISYKRLRKYTSAEVRAIFPPSSVRGWKRDVIAPLSSKTALILDLNGWPAQPELLRLFLSSFFFRDATPHFVLLVDDWMRLGMEIDSMRSGSQTTTNQPRPSSQSILSRLPRKDS
jgi:hypothetical protein